MLVRSHHLLYVMIFLKCSCGTHMKQPKDAGNRVIEVYKNKTITRTYLVHTNSTPINIKEIINVYIIPEKTTAQSEKKRVFPFMRDVEEIEAANDTMKSPKSTQGRYGVEWFGKGARRAPPERLRLPRAIVEAVDPVDLPHFMASVGDHQSGNDASLDVLADFVIDLVRKEIAKKGEDQIKIPDVHEKFQKRIGPIKLKGTFDAVNGWFKSLTSLHRTTDVSASRKGNYLTLALGVGLATMNIGYDNYKAKFEHLGPKGKIKGEVDHNSIVVELLVDISNPACKVTLQNLYFKEFSELKIHLTGLGKLSWTFSKIVTWITNRFKGKIVHDAENILKENVQKVLTRVHCYSDEVLTLHNE